jgi:DNA integrity scanning protein DisA with diadenylate cyclase activity
MIEEKAYNEISQLIKYRCNLPNYWHQLTVDQQDLVVDLFVVRKNIREEEMKHLLLERIRYTIEEYREEREQFANVEEAQESFDNLLDELETLVDDWFDNDKNRE